MQFILPILINPIQFIADGRVTNKSRRGFGIEQKFYSPERLKLRRNSMEFVFSTHL